MTLNSSYSNIHDNSLFSGYKQDIKKIEANVEEIDIKLQQNDQKNQEISNEVTNDLGKRDMASEQVIRETLMMQLRSPFANLSTEARLKSL